MLIAPRRSRGTSAFVFCRGAKRRGTPSTLPSSPPVQSTPEVIRRAAISPFSPSSFPSAAQTPVQPRLPQPRNPPSTTPSSSSTPPTAATIPAPSHHHRRRATPRKRPYPRPWPAASAPSLPPSASPSSPPASPRPPAPHPHPHPPLRTPDQARRHREPRPPLRLYRPPRHRHRLRRPPHHLCPPGAQLLRYASLIPWDSAQAGFLSQSDRLATELSTAIARTGIPVHSSRATLRPLDSLTCPRRPHRARPAPLRLPRRLRLPGPRRPGRRHRPPLWRGHAEPDLPAAPDPNISSGSAQP